MAYRGFYQEILVSVKCKVTVVVLQRQLFWQQFLSCHERLYRNYLQRVSLVSTHPPPTRSRDSRHTGSPRASWSTSLARSSRSPPCKCINISTCQHINISTYQHINMSTYQHVNISCQHPPRVTLGRGARWQREPRAAAAAHQGEGGLGLLQLGLHSLAVAGYTSNLIS